MTNSLRTSGDLFGFAAKIWRRHQSPAVILRTNNSCETYLEHMKALVLHHLPVVLELPHDELQVITRRDIAGHDIVKLTVQEHFAQQLDRLALGHVALRPDQRVVVSVEEEVEVCVDKFGHHALVLDQDLLHACVSLYCVLTLRG